MVGRSPPSKPAPTFAWAISLFFALLPVPAAACGYCVWAQMEYAFPAITAWWWIGCAWLLAEGALTTATQPYQFRQINLPNALILFFIFYILAMGFFGPLPLLLIFAHMLMKCFFAIRQWKRERTKLSLLYLILGGVALVAFTGSYAIQEARASRLTRVDWVLKSKDTPVGRQLLNEMGRDRDYGREDLAEILAKGEADLVWRATTPARRVYSREELMSLLLPAYRRLWSARSVAFLDLVQYEMRDLSGLKLPDGTPPDAWEAAWRDHPTTRTTPSR